MINGVDKIILTLIDALQGVDPIKVCIAYELNGELLENWPIHPEIIEKCIPKYREFEGWEELTKDQWSTIANKGYDALPKNMKKYIQAVREELQIDIAMISIGPKRNDTIILENCTF